jgi:Ca-activated chloride channel family protein
MNTRSFERQLQQLDPPAVNPEARLRARRVALEEFERIHEQAPVRPKQATRFWRGPWVGGLAAAGVATLGVAIFWNVPEQERAVALPQPPAVQASATLPVTERPATESESLQEVAVDAASTAADTMAQTPMQAELPSQTQVQTRTRNPAPEVAEAPIRPTVRTVEQQFSEPPASDAAQKAELEKLGMVNVADALTMLVPQQTASPISTTPAERRQFIDNTIANLRGLDPAFGSRTLTLVDGRREVSASNQADAGLAQVTVTGSRIVTPAGYFVPPPGSAVLVMPPTTTQGDQFEDFDTNAVKRTADEPVSTFSVDVDTTSYSYVRRQLNAGQLPSAGAVRAEEMINYFDYAWPAARSRRQPFQPTVTVSDSPWGAGRKLVHVGIRGYELEARSQPDANLVLLIDVSGSMNSPDKLPLVKRSMKLLLDSLKPTDTVSIVVYAGAAGQVLPPTAVRDRESIEAALDGLRPGGSTAGAQGIRLAYDLAQRSFRNGGVNRILLATDGDFNVGVSDPDELKRLVERERTRGVYLSVLGFGQGNYRDDIAQSLAQNGNGVAAYIDTLNEARKVLVREATSSLFTIAGDVKIQVEFNPATVAEYRLVGYETRALNREDFNNDRVDAGDVGSGRTVTAIYEITPVGSPAQLIDESRYAADAKSAVPQGRKDEYGYVKIRYKLPGADQSQLLQQPIKVDAGVPRALREDVAFSTAVAGFAQLLRGGQYTGALTWDDVLRQAAGALGRDAYGYRAEFVDLVGRARDASSRARELEDSPPRY